MILQLTKDDRTIITFILGAFVIFIIYISFRMFEMVYVAKKKKPMYVHFYPVMKRLNATQEKILESKFDFYGKLNRKEKRYFRHRVASFMNDKTFVGREGLEITDEVRVLISATAVMLTFGFRNYYIGLVSNIIVYPAKFYSKANDDYHKGEVNPTLKALVLSWKHFQQGFDIADDNLNLGIHEFTHAIHLNSIKETDVSSGIFEDSFKELTNLLSLKKDLREALIRSQYFRDYAYTNQFEFIAVIIENFIETPHEFRTQFPEIYAKTKQMLNFNFSGY